MKKSVLALMLVASSPAAHALNYYELEVYPYETASKGESELENTSSVSSVFRSSMEFNYGISDRWEVAAYSDMSNTGPQDQLAYDATRLHARTRFFEKGELPIDFGAYAEMEFHHRNDPATMESEFRGIIERDFGRFTLDINPILEKAVQGEGDLEFSYAASLGYRADRHWRPHLDLYQSVAGDTPELLLAPAIDVRVGKGFMISAMAAVALTDTTEEKQLGSLRVEYEF